jgi:hypothetical protein
MKINECPKCFGKCLVYTYDGRARCAKCDGDSFE